MLLLSWKISSSRSSSSIAKEESLFPTLSNTPCLQSIGRISKEIKFSTANTKKRRSLGKIRLRKMSTMALRAKWRQKMIQGLLCFVRNSLALESSTWKESYRRSILKSGKLFIWKSVLLNYTRTILLILLTLSDWQQDFICSGHFYFIVTLYSKGSRPKKCLSLSARPTSMQKLGNNVLRPTIIEALWSNSKKNSWNHSFPSKTPSFLSKTCSLRCQSEISSKGIHSKSTRKVLTSSRKPIDQQRPTSSK